MTKLKLVVAGLGLSCLALNPLLAEEPKSTGGATEARSPDSKLRPGTGVEAHNRLINQLSKLHDMMKEDLDLTDAQKKTVHGMFDEHMKEIKANKGRKASEKSEELKDEELVQMRDNIKQAREAGDTESVNNLRKQMRDKMREGRAGMLTATIEFLEKVEGQIDDDQVKPYQEMVKELGLDGKRDQSGDSLQDLMRSVMSPKVGLSDEQQKNIREIMKESFLSLDQNERSAGDFDGVTHQLRADLMNELTPEQQKIVDDLLKESAKKPAVPKGPTKPTPAPKDK